MKRFTSVGSSATPLDNIDELLADAGLQRGRVELLAPNRPGGAYLAIVECEVPTQPATRPNAG